MAEKTAPEIEDEADSKSRRSYAPDLRIMHKIDGVFEELAEEMDDCLMGFVLVRLCTKFAPNGFSFSKKTKEANGND